ncbi:MAG: methionyl-tRNA formyltransferase [Ruminococcaceae bacterium]|nr:methionyl-tRNA formyltransferase [Oscillospiraceae bacterium]
MRVLFMGTPDFAAECLKAVYNKDGVTVVGAVSQPDKPKGRGMKMIPTPVKEFAESVGIPVYQPVTLKDDAFLDELKALDPELIIVAAYGKLLPSYVLDYPKYGCVNAHGSLLPKYRGAAPIQRALIDGEPVTGITAMYMAEGLDTGDMILKLTTPITDEDDFGTLHDRLAILGGEAMCAVIDCINSGTVPREVQNDEEATYAAKILKEDTMVDFSRPAGEIFNMIRGLSPVPLAVTHTPDGKLLKLTSAKKTDVKSEAVPGTVVSLEGGAITVACGEGCIAITGVVPEGKSRMGADAYINGRKIAVGDILK